MEPYVPTFTPRVRTATYVAALFLSVLTALVCTLLVVLDILDVPTAAGVSGAVGIACGAIAGGMGVAYRPTRAVIHDDGTPATYVGRHVAD